MKDPVSETRKNDDVRQYLDVADTIIIVLGSSGKISLVNRKGCQILQRSEEEILNLDWFDHFIPEEQRESTRSVFQKLLAGEETSFEYFENHILTASGSKRLISWHNTLLRDEKGKVLGILSSGDDITEHRLAQSALRDSEATLRAILDTCVDGILTISDRGIIHTFNPAAEKIFGFPSSEVIGQNVKMLMPEPDRSRHDQYLENYRFSGNARVIGTGREVVGQKKDGSTFPMYLAVNEMYQSGQLYFTGIVRDLTDFRKMQNEIIQAQQLAAIGEMAASVAHEIKNPLAGIGGAIEILRDTFSEGDPHRDVMDDILGEVKRLDNTIRDLLSFSRPWSPDLSSGDLGEIAERIVSVYQEQERPNGVEFAVHQNSSNLEVPVDPWLCEKILWNLLENAHHAMSDGGQIQVEIERVPGYVRISVQDAGHGISSENIDHVFRPFFTTKNRGTGLGLAICKKIMDAHAGSISLSSQEGKGTRVSLQFPAEVHTPAENETSS